MTATTNSQNKPKVHAPNCFCSIMDQDNVWRDVFMVDSRFGPSMEIFDYETRGTRKKVYVPVRDLGKVFHRGQAEFGRLVLTYTSRDDSDDKGQIEIRFKPLKRDKQIISKGFTLMPLNEEMVDAIAHACVAKVKTDKVKARADKVKADKAKAEREEREAKQKAAAKAAKRREIERAESKLKEAQRELDKAKAKTGPEPKAKPDSKKAKPAPASEEQVESSKKKLKDSLQGKGKKPHSRKPARRSSKSEGGPKPDSRPPRKPREDRPRQDRPVQASPRPERKTRPVQPSRPRHQDRGLGFYDHDQAEFGRARMANDKG